VATGWLKNEVSNYVVINVTLMSKTLQGQYMFIHFDRIHERDGQTSGQTDTVRRHRPPLCIASHGKKEKITVTL